MNFPESEAYLYSLGNEVEAMKLGLENITTLLSELGVPHKKYIKVQVAGTNGKGSVCAFLNSICLEVGIKTGLYTSPHLVSITERIKIDGEDISESEFARLATIVRETAESLLSEGKLTHTPTYFEQVTAIGLLAFANAGVELAILETGLGGRYDAVTAANAEIAAITRIDLDHQEYLGNTIEEIAAEKAAIIRQGSIVVIGAQDPRALSVILERCERLGISPHSANKQFIFQLDVRSESDPVGEFDFEPPSDLGVQLGLNGRHQVENAQTAAMIAGTLAIEFGFDISGDQIKAGLEHAQHPGRLERIGRFLLDGAHNPSGAKALRAYLDEFVREPITLVFGAMRDKSVGEIAEILWPRAERVILTRPSNSRAISAGELATFAPVGIGTDRLIKSDKVAEAIEKAKELTTQDGVILVTGSLYLVGEVKKLLNN